MSEKDKKRFAPLARYETREKITWFFIGAGAVLLGFIIGRWLT